MVGLLISNKAIIAGVSSRGEIARIATVAPVPVMS
jgi:hypothetical protein